MSWLVWFQSALVLTCAGTGLTEEPCNSGQYCHTPVKGPKICLPCPDGKFMPYDDHYHNKCYPCTDIVDPKTEVKESSCNKTQDTVIKCVNGYYRYQPDGHFSKGECRQCTQCTLPQVTRVGCQPFADTVCCESEEHEAVSVDGVHRCIRSCQRGQFLNISARLCQPCPPGTFMHVSGHVYPHCNNCPRNETHEEVILRECNTTHPTLLGCKSGYYRRWTVDMYSAQCLPCQACPSDFPFPARVCDQFHDTVCCPFFDMSVIDSQNGPQCDRGSASLAKCKENEYLDIPPSTCTPTCLPCEQQEASTTGSKHCRTSCERTKRGSHSSTTTSSLFLTGIITGIAVFLAWACYRHAWN